MTTSSLTNYYNIFSGVTRALGNDIANTAKTSLREGVDALNDFTLSAAFLPKQTFVDRPIAAVKSAGNFIVAASHDPKLLREAAISAFNKAGNFIDNKLPASVPRDATTKAIVAFGAVAYLVDCWDPLPIGETVALTSVALATARGGYLLVKKEAAALSARMPETQPVGGELAYDNYGME